VHLRLTRGMLPRHSEEGATSDLSFKDPSLGTRKLNVYELYTVFFSDSSFSPFLPLSTHVVPGTIPFSEL
jgi:hypothetical protein